MAPNAFIFVDGHIHSSLTWEMLFPDPEKATICFFIGPYPFVEYVLSVAGGTYLKIDQPPTFSVDGYRSPGRVNPSPNVSGLKLMST